MLYIIPYINILNITYMSTATQVLHTFEKKTFNIKREYADAMKKLIPTRKQADFVNRAIEHELARETEKIQREEGLSMLKKMRQIRESLPRSTKTTTETLGELRGEMV